MTSNFLISAILPERPSNYCVALLDEGLLNESEMRRVARYGTVEVVFSLLHFMISIFFQFCDSSFQGMTHLVVETDENGFVPMKMSVLRAILK